MSVANAPENHRASAFELALIGGGNMGEALLVGLIRAQVMPADSIVVVERDGARRAALARHGVAVSAEIVAHRAAVLAVKPPDTAAVASRCAAAGAQRILSIAAGITTATLAAAVAPSSVAVLRAMPNTPALIGRGIAALAAGPGASEDDVVWAEGILRAVGTCVRLPEADFDAVTAVTGSGPAYVFAFAEALIDAAVEAGLPSALAPSLVSDLLVGSAALLAERGDPAALRAMVTSPGGTTAAGIAELEAHGMHAAIAAAVRAATARSRELGAT